MPNIALIEELKAKEPDLEITYIGSRKGMENDLLKDQPVKFKAIFTGKLRRYFSLKNFVDLFKVPIGIVQSYFILKKIRPQLVFSKGGYVSLPVVLAARMLKLPIVIHESDSIPGLTTKITQKYAEETWTTELPIRKFLKEGDPKKIKKKKEILLVMGGSLGAESINNFVKENIDEILEDFDIIHITGKGNSNRLKRDGYTKFTYVTDEMADIYAAADFVLSRAGASTLQELRELKKKAILIPLPTSKSRGEQLTNAKLHAEKYPTDVILEENLTLDRFKAAIGSLRNREFEELEEDEENVPEKLLALLKANLRAHQQEKTVGK